ncbi:MAG: hypothetical protein R3C44_22855 [Chloroflexota bacterium]
MPPFLRYGHQADSPFAVGTDEGDAGFAHRWGWEKPQQIGAP